MYSFFPVKHDAKCNICKMYPIIGLRFKCLKCLNYDMCQDCFFVARTTKRHKLTHPTQEYIIAVRKFVFLNLLNVI